MANVSRAVGHRLLRSTRDLWRKIMFVSIHPRVAVFISKHLKHSKVVYCLQI